MSSRRVRVAPLSERVAAFLNPSDLLLWLYEEINTSDWPDEAAQWTVPGSFVANIVFIIARANSGSAPRRADDIFSDYDERHGSGWLAWFATVIVYVLTAASLANAVFAFVRTRHYRMFEAPVEGSQPTSSARRVRVDSSPLVSTPLRLLQNALGRETAEERAHPDPTRDVWDLAIWDPLPLCLDLFCLFSPGHIIVYSIFLPTRPRDTRPSTTVVTTLALAALLSIFLYSLKSAFTQQAKDLAALHAQVQREYETKFVHPSLYKQVRHAGTQVVPTKFASAIPAVLASTPTTFINRGFHTSPNPNYAKHYNPDGPATPAQRRSFGTPAVNSAVTPATGLPTGPAAAADSSPLARPTLGPIARAAAAGARPSLGAAPSLPSNSHSHSQTQTQNQNQIQSPAQLSLQYQPQTHTPLRRHTAYTPRESSPLRRESGPLQRESPLKRSWGEVDGSSGSANGHDSGNGRPDGFRVYRRR